MGEMTQIILTSAFTIFGGIVIFVIGQLSLKFVIEPIFEFRRVLREIQFALIYHAKALHTPVEGDEERCYEAATVIRRLAADLCAKVQSIPFYGRLFKACGLPDRSSCQKAASRLIGLSNSLQGTDRSTNQARVCQIKRLLGFEEFEESRMRGSDVP